MEKILKENELRFGPGTPLEQLEKAKRGADYDLIIGAVRLNFIMEVKSILMKQINPGEKLDLITDSLDKFHKEMNESYEKTSHL